MKTQTRGRRLLSALCCLLFALTAFFATTLTSMAASTVDVYLVQLPRSSDSKASGTWGHSDLKYKNSWFSEKDSEIYAKALGSYDGKAAYCLEPSTALQSGVSLSNQNSSYWNNIPKNDQLSGTEQRDLIARILYYGYQGNVSTSTWVTQNSSGSKQMAKYWATQLLVWEVIVGERAADFTYVAPGSGLNKVTEYISTKSPIYSNVKSYYDSIAGNVLNDLKIPSFMAASTGNAKTETLSYDANTGKYTATLTDSNNVLSSYTLKADGVSLSVDGNKLTVTSDKPVDSVTITATKSTNSETMVVWGDGTLSKTGDGKQDVVTYGSKTTATKSAYVKVTAQEAKGALTIQKASDDGTLEGFSFHITGPNGYDQTFKTDKDGKVNVTGLAAGEYTIEETDVPVRYSTPDPQKISVKAGATAEVKVTNTLAKDYKLILTKVDKDYPENKLTGGEFVVYKDTDGDGKYTEGTDEELGKMTETETGVYEYGELTVGTYFVQETVAPEGFTLDEAVYTVVVDGTSKEVNVENDAESHCFINQPVPTTTTTTTQPDSTTSLTTAWPEEYEGTLPSTTSVNTVRITRWTTTPSTEDTTRLGLILALLAAGGTCAFAVHKIRKKDNKTDE